jgi:Lactoylglutathione lyase and related lyases
MKQWIASVTLVVRDYDEALAYFTETLGFRCREDVSLEDGKRWVVVAPAGSDGCGVLLARAKNDEERSAVGRQTGGRVFLFLHTDDFWRDYRLYLSRDVHFTESPREEPYGTVAVFEDLYGNRWDLLEPKKAERGEGETWG